MSQYMNEQWSEVGLLLVKRRNDNDENYYDSCVWPWKNWRDPVLTQLANDGIVLKFCYSMKKKAMKRYWWLFWRMTEDYESSMTEGFYFNYSVIVIIDRSIIIIIIEGKKWPHYHYIEKENYWIRRNWHYIDLRLFIISHWKAWYAVDQFLWQLSVTMVVACTMKARPMNDQLMKEETNQWPAKAFRGQWKLLNGPVNDDMILLKILNSNE